MLFSREFFFLNSMEIAFQDQNVCRCNHLKPVLSASVFTIDIFGETHLAKTMANWSCFHWRQLHNVHPSLLRQPFSEYYHSRVIFSQSFFLQSRIDLNALIMESSDKSALYLSLAFEFRPLCLVFPLSYPRKDLEQTLDFFFFTRSIKIVISNFIHHPMDAKTINCEVGQRIRMSKQSKENPNRNTGYNTHIRKL